MKNETREQEDTCRKCGKKWDIEAEAPTIEPDEDDYVAYKFICNHCGTTGFIIYNLVYDKTIYQEFEMSKKNEIINLKPYDWKSKTSKEEIDNRSEGHSGEPCIKCGKSWMQIDVEGPVVESDENDYVCYKFKCRNCGIKGVEIWKLVYDKTIYEDDKNDQNN